MASALLRDHALHGKAAGHHLFGGNVLAPRTTMTGEGSYDEAVHDLNVTGLRYPGGSLTEDYFDISNPDASVATHAETGETTDFVPISEFMSYAAENGHAVTIVLPTRYQLSEDADHGGDRTPAIDEEGLREFIHDLASGVYGDAEIRGFEIGNEYWGSGEMNAVEYGRLSSEMAKIIDSELALVSEVYGIDTDKMSVLAQMGHNYGSSNLSDNYEGWDPNDVIEDLCDRYPEADISPDNIWSGGGINWTEVNNELIKMSFDTDQEIEALDGIIGHVYTRGTDKSRHYDLDNIHKSWLSEDDFKDLEIHVTEWNLKSGTELDPKTDYGLYQAHDMLNTVEEFMAAGVDQAHVWPLIQNTSNPLCVGFDYSEATAPGKMFAMMSENLPGKMMLDFTPGGDRQTEYHAEYLDLHAFSGPEDMVIYLASTSNEAQVTDIDLSHLIAGFDEMEISVLGVAEGDSAGDTRSRPEMEARDPEGVYQDGVLEADLDPGEIMQVVIRGLVPTDEFAPTMTTIADIISGADPLADELDDDTPMEGHDDVDLPGSSTDPIDPGHGVPVTPPESEDDMPIETDSESGDQPDDSGWSELAAALALLPLFALFGMAM